MQAHTTANTRRSTCNNRRQPAEDDEQSHRRPRQQAPEDDEPCRSKWRFGLGAQLQVRLVAEAALELGQGLEPLTTLSKGGKVIVLGGNEGVSGGVVVKCKCSTGKKKR